jgi:septum formation protein
MRRFSDAFLDGHLKGDADILDCAGAYRLEGSGSQLFNRVQGDYFTVLGLPLLEVLGFLRTRGVCIE